MKQQIPRREYQRTSGLCARCGIKTTTNLPVRSVRLCVECRRDTWYVEKVGA